MNTSHYRLRAVLTLCLLCIICTCRSILAQPGFPAPDIRSTEVHDGDLILSGDDERIIEHTHLTVNGNIRLSGHARLVIRQSIIEIRHYPREELFVSDDAVLLADTTEFREFIHAYFMGRAQLHFQNCFFINLLQFGDQSHADIKDSWIFREPFGLLQLGSEADVRVQNSVCGAIGLELPAALPVRIDSLRPGWFASWSARENISPGLTYSLVLENCEVKDNPGYSGGYEMGWNLGITSANELEVSNSVLNKLMIQFDREDIRFTDLRTRAPIDFQYRNIHLVNSIIRSQWGMFVSEGNVEMDNCQGIWLWPMGTRDVTVSNSEINEFDPRFYTGTVRLENCSMTNGFEVYENSDLQLAGTIRMREISPLFDASSRLQRRYDVRVVDAVSGEAISDVTLRLCNGSVVDWRGRTDEQGRETFSLTFDIDNNTNRWILESEDSTYAIHRNVSLQSSTPLVIALERDGDGRRWIPVSYVELNAGSDGDGTVQRPYRSIRRGVKVVAGGGTVRVSPASYSEDVFLEDGVSLIGAGADSCTISGDVYAWSVRDASISGFTIVDSSTAGIHSYQSALTVANNVIRDQPHNGIHCVGSALDVRNNVLIRNGHNGIMLMDSSVVRVRNNVFSRNGQQGIAGGEFAETDIGYNDVWENSDGGYGEFIHPGMGDISADPQFEDETGNDYRLRSSSPCIDAGDPDPAFNDRDGSRNDMGVFGGPGGRTPQSTGGIDGNRSTHPGRIFLQQNYPNPFATATNIGFRISGRHWVTVTLHDVTGRRVRLLYSGSAEAGFHMLSWDGTDDVGNTVPGGMYVCQLRVGSVIRQRISIRLR